MAGDEVFKVRKFCSLIVTEWQGLVPMLGLVRVRYKDWRASVPREPLSRAISHNLGQDILLAIATARAVH